MPRFATLIYNGFWFTPEMKALLALIEETQKTVTGKARIRLYKGSAIVVGRKSPNSLYSADIASFDEAGGYDQKDAEGFIRLNALRLKLNRTLRRSL
jgi:argininosuccinate synthase